MNRISGVPQDILGSDYTSQTLVMRDDYSGPVVATLVEKSCRHPTRKAALYIHGFTDYFFKAELGERYIAHGFDFYALDLRKCGRSLLPHQVPNFCRDVDEYFEEIRRALEIIRKRDDHDRLIIHGHSTGALIISILAQMESGIDALILDSPFFAFNVSWFVRLIVIPIAAFIAGRFPKLRIPGGLSRTAGECIHSSYHGEWTYRLDWKPVGGFPLRAGWIRAVLRAQKAVHAGLSLSVPILVLHAAESSKQRRCTPRAMKTDTVLDVKDMVRYADRCGDDVTDVAIAGAMHDLVLSVPEVRERVYHEIFAWLDAALSSVKDADYPQQRQ